MKSLLSKSLAAGFLATSLSLGLSIPVAAQAVPPTVSKVKPPVTLAPGLPAPTFDRAAFDQGQVLISTQGTTYQRLGEMLTVLKNTKTSIEKLKTATTTATKADTAPTAHEKQLLEALNKLTLELETQRKKAEEEKAAEKLLAAETGIAPGFTLEGNPDGGTSLFKMALDVGAATPVDARVYYDQYKNYISVDKALALVGSDDTAAQVLGDKVSKAVVTSSMAEVAYVRAGESMLRMPSYMEKLNASATLKESVDLNTRVLLELLQTSNELLRTSAATSFTLSQDHISVGVQAATSR